MVVWTAVLVGVCGVACHLEVTDRGESFGRKQGQATALTGPPQWPISVSHASGTKNPTTSLVSGTSWGS